MPGPSDFTPLLPQPFQSMQEGYDDPQEVAAVQRFLLRVGGPSIAMKLMPGGANGKFDSRMKTAIEAYQDKFGIEVPENKKGVLDVTTSRHMSELRGELTGQDRRPDVTEHLVSQMPQLPRHHLETSEGPQAMLRSAQLHAVDATANMKAQKPNRHVTEYVQEMLASRGYPLGPAGIDGKPGKFTLAALQDYQRDAGLKPVGFLKDGSLDPATLELMKADEEALQKRTMMQQPRIDVPDAAPPTGGSIGGLSSLTSMLLPEAGPPVVSVPSVIDPANAAAALGGAPSGPAGDAAAPPSIDNNFGRPPDPNRAPDGSDKRFTGPADIRGRDYQVPQQGGLLNGNVNIHIGPVVEQGMFGRTVRPGIRIKLF